MSASNTQEAQPRGPVRAAGPGPLRTEAVPSLGSASGAWDALVAHAPLASPFLMSWWLRALEGGPGSGYVLVRAGDELIGGLPVAVDRWGGVRRVRILGTGPLAPDHLDLVAAPARVDEVVAALRGWLGEQRALLDLSGVAPAARLLGAVPARRVTTDVSVSPFLPLPGPDAAPVGPVRRRRDLRKQRARLANLGARYRQVDGHDRDDLERALAVLRALHVERWGDRSGFARSFERFAMAARASSGAVRIHELVADDRVVAAEVSLDAGPRRHRYQVGRSADPVWRGAGNVLLAEVIEHTQREGFAEFDFLRGPEAYKYDWTALERPVQRVRCATSALGGALTAGLEAAERFRPLGRRVKQDLRRLGGRPRSHV